MNKQFFAQNVPTLATLRGFVVSGTNGLFTTLEADESTSQNVHNTIVGANQLAGKGFLRRSPSGMYNYMSVGINQNIMALYQPKGSTQNGNIVRKQVDPIAGEDSWYCVAYNRANDRVVIGGNSGSISYITLGSTNIEIQRGDTIGNSDIRGIAYSNDGKGVLCGNNYSLYYCNANSNIWNRATITVGSGGSLSNVDWHDVIWANGYFYALGSYGSKRYIARSNNGAVWYWYNLNYYGNSALSKLAYGNGILYAWVSTPVFTSSGDLNYISQDRYIYQIPISNLGSSGTTITVAKTLISLDGLYYMCGAVWDEESSRWYWIVQKSEKDTFSIRCSSMINPNSYTEMGGKGAEFSSNGRSVTGFAIVPSANWTPK